MSSTGQCTCGIYCWGQSSMIPDQVICTKSHLEERIMIRGLSKLQREVGRYDFLPPAPVGRSKRSKSDYDSQPNSVYQKNQWSFSRMIPTCPDTNCKLFFTLQPAVFRWNPLIDLGTSPIIKPHRPVDGKDWVLTFSDEFSEAEINLNRWTAIDRNRGSQDKGQFDVWWKKEAVRARPDRGDGQAEIRFEKNGKVVTSGHLNTDCKFEQRKGFFEARIQMVRPDAKQSMFWLYPNEGTMG